MGGAPPRAKAIAASLAPVATSPAISRSRAVRPDVVAGAPAPGPQRVLEQGLDLAQEACGGGVELGLVRRAEQGDAGDDPVAVPEVRAQRRAQATACEVAAVERAGEDRGAAEVGDGQHAGARGLRVPDRERVDRLEPGELRTARSSTRRPERPGQRELGVAGAVRFHAEGQRDRRRDEREQGVERAGAQAVAGVPRGAGGLEGVLERADAVAPGAGRARRATGAPPRRGERGMEVLTPRRGEPCAN